VHPPSCWVITKADALTPATGEQLACASRHYYLSKCPARHYLLLIMHIGLRRKRAARPATACWEDRAERQTHGIDEEADTSRSPGQAGSCWYVLAKGDGGRDEMGFRQPVYQVGDKHGAPAESGGWKAQCSNVHPRRQGCASAAVNEALLLAQSPSGKQRS
jgi:hypothetical protein